MYFRKHALLICILPFFILVGCSVNQLETINSRVITLDEYHQLTKGLPLEEAIEIIGGEGKISSESGKKGTPSYQIGYVWDGEAANSFAHISFQNNKVITKMQTGLR
ncbi:hypothetical protein [Rossellomorea aquimaris]|uniref:hypothetical protein n=1 Tax=Rossellomorea aquimaris TaxID=189382 RepID=UPI0007D04BAF|nr:hypothetical protein [Rossellomorea aquimaris]